MYSSRKMAGTSAHRSGGVTGETRCKWDASSIPHSGLQEKKTVNTSIKRENIDKRKSLESQVFVQQYNTMKPKRHLSIV
jgi:hypothetical protein